MLNKLINAINDFVKDLQYSSYVTPIQGLGNIIPLQYLESQEENAVFAYNGTEYGFYVSKIGDFFDVLLIDFVSEYEEDRPHSDLEFKIEIKPILQQRFERRAEKNGGYSWYLTNNLGYTYYVANPRFTALLLNENALNYNDVGYSKYEDDGLLISQIRVNYGKVSNPDSNSGDAGFVKELAGKVVFDLSCLALDAIAPGSGTVTSFVGSLAGFASDNADVQEITILADNENNIETQMSKTDQLANENLDGFFRRVSLDCNEESKIFLSSADDSFAEFITVLNDANYNSRLIQVCDFDIYRQYLDGPIEYATGAKEDKKFSFNKERYQLFEDQNPKFEIDGDKFDSTNVPVYLLPYGTQKISFTPSYSGVYNFDVPFYAELSLNGVVDDSFMLYEGNNYVFDLSCHSNVRIIDFLRCFVDEFSAEEEYTVPANANKLLKFYPTDSGYKKVRISNNNLSIGLLDEDMHYLVQAQNGEFDYHFIQGRKYYFIIVNNTVNATTANISMNLLQEISLGTFKLLDTDIIVSFTNPYNASTNYQLSLNDPSALSAVITDKFSNVLSTTSTSQDGKVIYSFDIGANETCYVQFLGNADANSSAILAVNSKQLKWIINGKPCSNNTKLKPNSQNTIELNIESDGKLLDVVKNFTISTTIKDYRHWEGQLYIGEVENGSEMHIIPVCAVDYTCIVIVDDMIRNITLMHCNGTQNFDKVNVELGQTIRGAAMPQWTGHKFMGYFTGENGQGDEYINQDMQSVVWDENKTCDTLFAYWEVNTYTLTYSYETEYGTREFKVDIKYNDPIPSAYKFAPSLAGHEFEGYFSEDGKRQFYRMEIINDEQGAAIQGGGYILVEGMVPIGNYDIADDITIKARFKLLSCNYAYENYIVEGESYTYNSSKSISLTHGVTFNLTPMEIEGYNFDHFYINGKGNVTDIPTAYTPNLYRSSADAKIYPRNYIMCYYTKNCVAQGTLITLADGTQVPVETLTGNEMLMVWNMITGRLEAASILFIDKDPAQVYKVINLGFSDGTTVKVISEHGFWDYDLNKYVYLRQDASKYIGHWFNKGETRVQLVSVDVRDEYTSSYSPVTYGHLCYYVNGMLSMPGGISGLFNIFEVNPDTMTINLEAMDRDIALYGLYTYDEFAELVPVSEDVFNAFNGQYLKVAVGKGLITVEQLNNLASRYAEFFV